MPTHLALKGAPLFLPIASQDSNRIRCKSLSRLVFSIRVERAFIAIVTQLSNEDVAACSRAVLLRSILNSWYGSALHVVFVNEQSGKGKEMKRTRRWSSAHHVPSHLSSQSSMKWFQDQFLRNQIKRSIQSKNVHFKSRGAPSSSPQFLLPPMTDVVDLFLNS